MKITVVGIGYVGQAYAVSLAKQHKVIALDIDKKKVDLINQKNLSENLSATLDPKIAYKNAECIIIATPTDYDDKLEMFHTQILEDVLSQIASLNPNAIVVIKSTVPIGYTKKICKKYPQLIILFSPEFLRENNAIYDIENPSRIIVGIPYITDETQKSANTVINLFKNLSNDRQVECLIMSSDEAEAVKLFSNSYLAMRIAFFNELDTFCEVNNLSTLNVINGVCKDSRIGNYYNNPSFGYGGYCLPKDSKQLKTNFANIPQKLISAIVDSNQTRIEFVVNEIIKRSPTGTIGIYRLVAKLNSNNYRTSSLIRIIDYLKQLGRNIIIYEPIVERDSIFGVTIVKNLKQFKQKTSLIVANRYDDSLEDVKEKLYTRDIFCKD